MIPLISFISKLLSSRLLYACIMLRQTIIFHFYFANGKKELKYTISIVYPTLRRCAPWKPSNCQSIFYCFFIFSNGLLDALIVWHNKMRRNYGKCLNYIVHTSCMIQHRMNTTPIIKLFILFIIAAFN